MSGPFTSVDNLPAAGCGYTLGQDTNLQLVDVPVHSFDRAALIGSGDKGEPPNETEHVDDLEHGVVGEWGDAANSTG